MKTVDSRLQLTIDVIIPVLNGEQFIREALESIDKLNEQPERIILLDNCSTDQTALIMKTWAVGKSNVEFYQTERVLGFAENWNYGLSLSNSDYVHFLAHDDKLHPNFVKTFKKIAKKHVAATAYIFRAGVFGDKSKSFVKTFSIPIEYVLNSRKHLLKSVLRNPFNLAGGVFHREKISSINFMNPEYSIWSDWVLWQNVLMTGSLIRSFRIMSFYRVHSDLEKKIEREQLVIKDLELMVKNQFPIIFNKLNLSQAKQKAFIQKMISSVQIDALIKN